MSPQGLIKLADFGHAIDTREERPVTRLGTLNYMVGKNIKWFAVMLSVVEVTLEMIW